MNGIAVDPSSGQAYIAGAAGSGLPTTVDAYQPSNPSTSTSPFLMALSADGRLAFFTLLISGRLVFLRSREFWPGLWSCRRFYGRRDESSGEIFCLRRLRAHSVELLRTRPFPFPQSEFVTEFNATGSALVYATTLCGSADSANAVAIDGSGASYVTGAVHEARTFLSCSPSKVT